MVAQSYWLMIIAKGQNTAQLTLAVAFSPAMYIADNLSTGNPI